MKIIKKYSAIIALICLAVYDAIVLILRNNEKYNTIFWLGFIFVQVAFGAYIVVKLLKVREGERGVKVLDLSLAFFIALMLLMSFVAYCLPNNHGAITGMVIGYIVLTGLSAVLIVFGLLNKAIVKANDDTKPQVFDDQDLNGMLQQAANLVKDEQAKAQINKIIERVSSFDVDEKSADGKKLIEYCQFIYKNAKRNETNNIFYNIKKVIEILDEIQK